MDKEKRQRLIIKICCVIAAFILWLYISNVENPVITYKIKNVPVELKNVNYIEQYKLTLIPQESYYVDLMIKGVASEVYNIKTEDFKVIADMSAYVLKNGENRIPVEIKYSPDNMSIVQNGSLWAKVVLDELIRKNVPVEINVKGTPASGYLAGNSVLKPTEVIVYGAAKYVNAVEKVSAEVDIDDAKKDVEVSLALKAVDLAHRTLEEVKLQTDFADVVIPIKKVKFVDIKVNTIDNLNKEYTLKSITSEYNKLAIVGDEEIVEKINILETEVIDLSKIDRDTSTHIALILPSGIKLQEDVTSVKVDIDVEKIINKNLSYIIKIKNYNEEYKVELDKQVVTIGIEGEESIIKEIDYKDIYCNIDLRGMEEGEHLVPVNVILPQNIKMTSKSPEIIKVRIYKSETDSETETVSKTETGPEAEAEGNTDEAVETQAELENEITDDTEVQNDNTGE